MHIEDALHRPRFSVEVTLNAGEVLYLPKTRAHFVVNESASRSSSA